jgi:hypothetical protein
LLPWTVVLLAKYLGTGVYIALSGALAISSLTLVKLTRYKPPFFFSVFFVLLLLMSLIWTWTDVYLVRIISMEILRNHSLVINGILDGVISIALILLYQKQLNRLRMKINYDWYASKTYRKFIRVVIYFLLFLFLFWIFSFLFHYFLQNTNYEKKNITIGAAVVAFIITGTQTVLYLIRPPAVQKSQHHRHHSRHRTGKASGT